MSPAQSGIRAPTQPPIAGDYQYRALRSGPAIQRFWHRGKIEVLNQVLPIDDRDVVVDLGCGSGNLTVEASHRSRLAIGVDPSLEAVHFSRSRPDSGRCSFSAAIGHRLPFADNSVDVALLVEVIEHIPDPTLVLAEINRVLRRRGRLLVTTPNYGPGSLWPALEWLADRSRLVASMADEQHVQAFSGSTLVQLLEAAGYEIDRIGSFYRWSPLVALVSPKRASALLSREVADPGFDGAILFAVARSISGGPSSL